MTVKPSAVTTAVVDCLRTNHPNPVGDGGIPTGEDQAGKVRAGYVVVVENTAPIEWEGYLSDPGGLMRCRVQVIGVGISRRHASMVRDRAVEILCDRDDTDNAYLYPLTVPDHSVQVRKRQLIAPVMQEGGTFNAPAVVEVLVAG